MSLPLCSDNDFLFEVRSLTSVSGCFLQILRSCAYEVPNLYLKQTFLEHLRPLIDPHYWGQKVRNVLK